MNNIENLTIADMPLIYADLDRRANMPHVPYVIGSDPWENTSADATSPF